MLPAEKRPAWMWYVRRLRFDVRTGVALSEWPGYAKPYLQVMRGPLAT
ncbi:hypothetical protein EDC40_104569 [Aminobacter aminovorans]|uniref:Uncharacterized protein n=1 Tax=Aminobacter aminovorans TaxID=83263 RepID=A0A380WGF9_AMIAI|nr:hypothetical protein EDC40_104569 [Aminobacter aminovorans]SUU87845.1 Uncharacterised protein [Aminobacter aminovorans]